MTLIVYPYPVNPVIIKDSDDEINIPLEFEVATEEAEAVDSTDTINVWDDVTWKCPSGLPLSGLVIDLVDIGGETWADVMYAYVEDTEETGRMVTCFMPVKFFQVVRS